MEMVRPKHLLDAAVASLDHAIGLRVRRRGQAGLDAEVAAEQVERVLAGGCALAQAELAVGELFSVIRKYGADPYRAGPFEIA